MIPINKAERSKAFMNFLLFFAITIAVIVAALLFSFQVPFKENEQLLGEMKVLEKEKEFLNGFELKMQETILLLDSVNLSANPIRINTKIDNNIKLMTATINDSIAVSSLCNKVLDNLRSLQTAKEQLRTANNSNAEMEKKDRSIDKLTADLKECNRQLSDIYSRSQQR